MADFHCGLMHQSIRAMRRPRSALQGLEAHVQDVRLMSIIAPPCRSSDEECPDVPCI